MTNEEAIKFLSQIMDALLASNSWLPSTDNPIKESFGMAINALTAQPERIRGKWTVKEGELAFWDMCSVCRKVIIHMVPHYNFCPHCGADMRVEQE